MRYPIGFTPKLEKRLSTISINNETRPLDQADADWITGQVNGRRKDGVPVCVTVNLQATNIHIALATPGCSGRGGGGGSPGRPPNGDEREVFELWSRHHLDESNFPVGQLVAFIRQLLRLL